MLGIARASVERELRGVSRLVVEPCTGALTEHHGAFVTLRKDGRLRGCIGEIEPRGPLAETVARCAILAAIDDPRFAPLTLDEMPAVRFEVSVLSHSRQVVGVAEIRPGIDGVIVSLGRFRALLLPQTAIENGWKAEELVAAACVKAGLERDAWLREDVSIAVFTAEVFSE